MRPALWQFLTPVQWAETARRTAAMEEPVIDDQYGEQTVKSTLCRRDSNLGGYTFHDYRSN
jgi:hypothetical protein